VARGYLAPYTAPADVGERGSSMSRAHVGLTDNQRCAVMALYRETSDDGYVLDGFAFIVQVAAYSTGGVHVLQKP